jgi:hypothetical protein
MQSKANDRRSYDGWLLVGLIAYGLVNILGVLLAATGVVHPPWNILLFFMLVGPALGILGVVAGQAFSGCRLFTWPALVGFVLAMLLAAYLNSLAFASASAAV